MSSSYIVGALFVLIKLNIVFPPRPTLKHTTLIAHVCDRHRASQENETVTKGDDV